MPNSMDQAVSKGTGLAHEIKARMDGLVGVFKTLAQQHGEAGALLERAQADAGKRADLWPTIRAALKSHEQGELREVYPALRRYAELEALADQHDVEASELSRTIDQMDAMGPSAPQFGAHLDRLIGLVQAHVAEEEKEIFPRSQKVIGAARAEELEPKFLAVAKQVEQAEMPSQMH